MKFSWLFVFCSLIKLGACYGESLDATSQSDEGAFDVSNVGKVDEESKFYGIKSDGGDSKLKAVQVLKNVHNKKSKKTTDKEKSPAKKVSGSDKFYVVANVNNDVITNVDIMNEIRFIFFSSGKMFNWNDAKLMTNVILKRAIDGKLQQQVSDRNNMKISDFEINQRVQDVANRNNVTIEELSTRFENLGINMEIFKKNIASRMLFSAIVEAMKNNVNLGDREINAAKKQAEEENKQHRYHVYEIHLRFVDKKTKQDAIENAKVIYKLLKDGFNFEVLAESVSQGNYRLQVGDLGWICKKNIDKSIEKTVMNLKPGTFSDIIETNTGIKIVYLDDEAEPGKKGSSEASYKYLKTSFQHQGGIMTSKDVEKVNQISEKIQKAKNSEEFKKICKEFKLECVEKEEPVQIPFIKEIFNGAVGKSSLMQSIDQENFVDAFYVISKNIPNVEVPSDEEIKKKLISKHVAKDFQKNFKQAEHMAFIKIHDDKLKRLVSGN